MLLSNQTPSVQHRCDVLIVGGGPAGATAGALLARRGRDVALIEKAHHPRIHIAESLLPANVALFDQLGVRQKTERFGAPKSAVEFGSLEHEHEHELVSQVAFGRVDFSHVDFDVARDQTMPRAWQLRRASFDEILFRQAGSDGVRTMQGDRAQGVTFDNSGAKVYVERDDGERQLWRTCFTVDASASDTLVANHLKAKRKNKRHTSSALYGHCCGAQRVEGEKEGNISTPEFRHGWFCFMPLADDSTRTSTITSTSTSTGAVCWPEFLRSRSRPRPESFADTIAKCPTVAARLQGAELIDDMVQATGDYAHAETTAAGLRHAFVGVAYAHMDAEFPRGVQPAMKSALAGVDLVETALDRPRRLGAAHRRFGRRTRDPRRFSGFIFRVTNPTMHELFMHPQNPLRVREALMSVLAGDIYGTTPIWGSLRVLKSLYYLISFVHLGHTLRALRQRRRNIRTVGMALA